MCPECGVAQDDSPTRHCTACGADLVARRHRQRPGRRRVALSLLAAILALAAIGALMRQSRQDARQHERVIAERQDQIQRSELERLVRESRPRSSLLPGSRGHDLATERRRALGVTERLITRDARARVVSGAMDGPVIGTRCRLEPQTATRVALETNPSAERLPYGCVALKARFEVPQADGRRRTGRFGHPYRAVIDVPSGRVTWCRLFPGASEGAQSLATVPLARACRARIARPPDRD